MRAYRGAAPCVTLNAPFAIDSFHRSGATPKEMPGRPRPGTNRHYAVDGTDGQGEGESLSTGHADALFAVSKRFRLREYK
jgi:hypothetical protein